MSSSRRHSQRPVVVELRPEKQTPDIAPSGPSSPSSPLKSVRFAPKSEERSSRPLTPVEAWSLYNFETHVRQCVMCFNSLRLYRHCLPLCTTGRGLAGDVACHVFSRHSDIYSTQRDDTNLVRVEVPLAYTHLRQLLRNMELSASSYPHPVVSYDRPPSSPLPSRQTSTPGPKLKEGVISSVSTERRHRGPKLDPIHDATVVRKVLIDDDAALKPKSSQVPDERGTLYQRGSCHDRLYYRVEVREPERQERRRHRQGQDGWRNSVWL